MARTIAKCNLTIIPPELGEVLRSPVNSNVPERQLSKTGYGSSGS